LFTHSVGSPLINLQQQPGLTKFFTTLHLIIFDEKNSRKAAKPQKVIYFKNLTFFAPLREELSQI
jgi:hypothetical protein